VRTLKTFQGTHILGASRGLLCDSYAVLSSFLSIHSTYPPNYSRNSSMSNTVSLPEHKSSFTATFWFLNLHSTLPTLPTVSRENSFDHSDSSRRNAAYTHHSASQSYLFVHNIFTINTLAKCVLNILQFTLIWFKFKVIKSQLL